MKLFKKKDKSIDTEKFTKQLIKLGIAEPLLEDQETIDHLERLLETKRKEIEEKKS